MRVKLKVRQWYLLIMLLEDMEAFSSDHRKSGWGKTMEMIEVILAFAVKWRKTITSWL